MTFMRILGIETSCDETSAAIVENGHSIVSNVVASQIDIHCKYFGVVPELASRAHIENINWVLAEALKEANVPLNDLNTAVDAIAYTRGPGLAGALLVGQIAAQTLSYLYRLPLVDVNHLEGHLYAAMLEHQALCPPYLALIVSGGHTELIIVKKFGAYTVLGGTRDDAAGEAFDKVAKLLNLSYPGGPVIDARAKEGNSIAIKFPRPYLPENWDFSFSGLKTAVVNYVKDCEKEGKTININDVCASFQAAVIDTLVKKTMAAATQYGMKRIVIGGGVAANSSLRSRLKAAAKKEKCELYLPSPGLCTDNAAMIASAGFFKLKTGKKRGTWTSSFQRIEPNLKLENWKK
jgi:N6-L-threonylcarbamoyladenine synthase